MDPSLHEPSPPPQLPKSRPRWKSLLGALVGCAPFLLQFGAKAKALLLPALKFLPLLVKSGGSMILMVGIYAATWGWRFAVGFVLLLLLHECGHLVAARLFGLRVGAPVFIPFMGAFIALKDAPRDAWMEAWVGIGGPLLGSFGALLCHGLGYAFGSPLFIALAWSGYSLNLFNMIPIGTLDGGRIATAISPWLWVGGVAVLGWMLWLEPTQFLLWLILLASLPRLFSLFRTRSLEEERFYEISLSRRWFMAGLYFCLLASLTFAVRCVQIDLAAFRQR